MITLHILPFMIQTFAIFGCFKIRPFVIRPNRTSVLPVSAFYYILVKFKPPNQQY